MIFPREWSQTRRKEGIFIDGIVFFYFFLKSRSASNPGQHLHGDKFENQDSYGDADDFLVVFRSKRWCSLGETEQLYSCGIMKRFGSNRKTVLLLLRVLYLSMAEWGVPLWFRCYMLLAYIIHLFSKHAALKACRKPFLLSLSLNNKDLFCNSRIRANRRNDEKQISTSTDKLTALMSGQVKHWNGTTPG